MMVCTDAHCSRHWSAAVCVGDSNRSPVNICLPLVLLGKKNMMLRIANLEQRRQGTKDPISDVKFQI